MLSRPTDRASRVALDAQISGSVPNEVGSLYPLRYLRINDNKLDGNLTNFDQLGNLRNLITLDLYNNQMTGDVPASIQNLTSLQYLYLDNQHYKPLRQKYCRQRYARWGRNPRPAERTVGFA